METVACHSALRAGETLTENERAELLRQAESVDFYHNCPHGRRVLRIFDKRKLEGGLTDCEKYVFKEFLDLYPSASKPVILIAGPTASGKTALSLRIAQAF